MTGATSVGLPQVAVEIGRAWRELRRVGSRPALRRLVAGDDEPLEVGEQDTLDLLAEHGPVTMAAVATLLRVDISTASRAVDRLEAKGLAERSRSASNRRFVEVALTEAGTARRQRSVVLRAALLARVLSSFDEDEQRQLAELLGRLVVAIDAEVAAADAPD